LITAISQFSTADSSLTSSLINAHLTIKCMIPKINGKILNKFKLQEWKITTLLYQEVIMVLIMSSIKNDDDE